MGRQDFETETLLAVGGFPDVTYAIQGGGRTSQGSQGSGWKRDVCFTLNLTDEHAVATSMAVRRLTPRECERLQGFPDGHTNVLHRGKPAADGPRYKALGNSWAVPCVRWIGERIQKVDNMEFPPIENNDATPETL